MQKLIIIIVSLFISSVLFGQDQFRYTLFDFSPITLNPANAGSFEGTVRAGTLLREQDYGYKFGQYQSPVIFVDAPLIRGFRKMDWVGFGFSFQHDQQLNQTQITDDNDIATNNNLITTTVIGGLSYHLSLDKNRKNIISVGFQTGNSSAYLTDQYFRLPMTIVNWLSSGSSGQLGTDIVQGTPSEVDKKSLNLGYTVGLNFTSNLNQTDYLKVGFSVGHIGRYLRYSILNTGSGFSLPLKYTAFGNYRTELANGLILEPRFVFSFLQPSWRASGQLLAGIKLTKPTPMILYGGLGYDPVNGMQVLISSDIKDFKVGISFDINFSDRSAVSSQAGAFELGLSYILKVYRKPTPDPVLVCPQL